MLDIALLYDFLSDVSKSGYDVLAVSGGEPLMYKPLSLLLNCAKDLGLHTTLTTNGMLLDEKRLKQIAGVIDLIAISLDGVPESHNRMRASEHAFERMSSRLEGLRQSGVPFGFLFTLTQYNLDELRWVAQFAVEQGARLLQIHPLEKSGRAIELLQAEFPDALEASYAYLEAEMIRVKIQDQLRIQVDLVNRNLLRLNPEKFYADLLFEGADKKLLSEVVSPLILEPDGTVVPLLYGFSRKYSLGNLKDKPLRHLYPVWRKRRLPKFLALCEFVYRQETERDEEPFFNWYEAVAQASLSVGSKNPTNQQKVSKI